MKTLNYNKWLDCEVKIVKAQVRLQRCCDSVARMEQVRIILRQGKIQDKYI